MRAEESEPGGAEQGAAPATFGRPLLAAAVAFFLSGAAGLIYQVAWQRILALQSGVGIYSVAMIVAAFMAGLGLGSHLGGVWSLRLGARGALRAFVAVELGVGLFGAASSFLYYDLLYQKAYWLYSAPWRAGLFHFAALAVPTALMGMSLPLLSRAMVAEVKTAGRTIGLLYGINLLGASVGALLTPWVLLRLIGVRGAVLAAAAGNVVAALLAWALAGGRRETEPPEPLEAVRASAPAHPLALWMALYAMSGLCALALEIVWFRLLDLAVKSRAFTFGTLLSLYLLGSALGCLAIAPRVQRIHRPLRLFLGLQCLLLAYAVAAVVLLATLPPAAPGYDWLYHYWARGGRLDAGALLRLYVVLPMALFGPPTLLMGAAFPILQRAVHDQPRTAGRKVGLLQAANIAGCTAGSLAVALLALGTIGSTGVLRLLALIGVGFALLGLKTEGRRWPFAALAVVLGLLAVGAPGQQRLWQRLHAADGRALIGEDATGVAALLPREGHWIVYVDGKTHSWIPFGGVHTRLGVLPAVLHPAPVDVAIVGLGSGNTAWAAACRPETRSLTVFEISGPQPKLLRRLSDQAELPELRQFLDDPRLRIRTADGRNALLQDGSRYDLIEADALWPDTAYAGNLYSLEFFSLCADRLKPGGLVCTWGPTARVYEAFIGAFPYVAGPPSRHFLVGSNQPIEIDVEAWTGRLLSPEVVAYLGLDEARRMLGLLQEMQTLNRRGRQAFLRHANRDLFPRDEFGAP